MSPPCIIWGLWKQWLKISLRFQLHHETRPAGAMPQWSVVSHGGCHISSGATCGSDTLWAPCGTTRSVSTLISAPSTDLCLLQWSGWRAECRVRGRDAQRDPPPLLTAGPTLPSGRKRHRFGPEPESISHGAASLKERDHCHAWVPSPAEGGSQALPGIGVIPLSGMPCSRWPRGSGAASIWPFVWGCAPSPRGLLPTRPQRVERSRLLCFLLIPALRALRPPLLHLTIVAFSHRFIDLGNSPWARIYHALVMLATAQILRPSTTGPATMHTWSKGLRSVSC